MLMMEPAAAEGDSIFAPGELVSHWKFDAATGQLVDSFGTNHLTKNGTVGSVSGKFGEAADFSGAGSLSCANNPTLQTGGRPKWFYCGWLYAQRPSSTRYMLAKDVIGQREFNIGLEQRAGAACGLTSDLFELGSYVGSLSHPIDYTLAAWNFWIYGFTGMHMVCAINDEDFAGVEFDGTSSGTADLYIGDSVVGGGHAYLQTPLDSVTFAYADPTEKRDALFALGVGVENPL